MALQVVHFVHCHYELTHIMKKTSLTIIASTALVATLAIAPLAAFAKDGNKGPSLHANAMAQASTTEHVSCAKAFGHLFAPGWLKKHGNVTISSACKLPFGIGFKLGLFGHEHGTTTPDTAAPALSLIAAAAGTTTATVTWTTNEPASTQLVYGTTTAYGSTTTLNTTLGLTHAVNLTGLTASTTYHYQVMSRDAAGNLATSSDRTFTTNALGDVTPPAISALGVSNIGSTTARVSWTTNEPATSKVYFAAGNSVDLNTASSVASSALVTSHSVTLGGLSASTTYSFAVQSQDAFGNLTTSASSSFATSL
jgi:hypothetical protein